MVAMVKLHNQTQAVIQTLSSFLHQVLFFFYYLTFPFSKLMPQDYENLSWLKFPMYTLEGILVKTSDISASIHSQSCDE